MALVVARWLNFTAVAGLFGMALFPLYAPTEARRVFLSRTSVGYLFLAGGVLSWASTLGWAGAALVYMAGDSSALWDGSAWSSFLFETSFGYAWLARGVLATLAMLTVSATQGRSAFAIVAALAAGLLVSQAWVGHVGSLAAPMRWGVVIAYAFHVLGAGAWFGGLLGLAVVMSGFGGVEVSNRKAAEDVLTRFSSVGLVAVFAILIGGTVNALALGAPSFATALSSGWGRALILKVALVGCMLALACLNRFVLTPRHSMGKVRAFPALRCSVLVEQSIAIAVLAASAMLGVLDPSS